MEFKLYKETLPVKSYAKTAIGSGCQTPMTKAFFSSQNIDIIQHAIRYEVWKRSSERALIDRQSDDELITAMRAIYFQYAKNRPDDIPGQIKELNTIVVNEVVPGILSEATAHLLYLKDKFGGLSPLPPPVNVNNAGTKLLRSVTSVF